MIKNHINQTCGNLYAVQGCHNIKKCCWLRLKIIFSVQGMACSDAFQVMFTITFLVQCCLVYLKPIVFINKIV